MSVPVERPLPIAVVVTVVAILAGNSVPVLEQSGGVGGGGAVPAWLLLPIYLGRRVLLKETDGHTTSRHQSDRQIRRAAAA